jgi:hypothetical protein
MIGHVARVGERRGVYRIIVGKREGKSSLVRRKRRWEDSIKKDLQEVGLEGMVWIDLAEYRDRWRAIMNAVMNFQAAKSGSNFLTIKGPVSFSERFCSVELMKFSLKRLFKHHTVTM